MIFQSTHVGTDTGSDTGSYTDISSHISPQIEILDKEAIYRVYQQKFGNIILGILQRIGLILLYISDKWMDDLTTPEEAVKSWLTSFDWMISKLRLTLNDSFQSQLENKKNVSLHYCTWVNYKQKKCMCSFAAPDRHDDSMTKALTTDVTSCEPCAAHTPIYAVMGVLVATILLSLVMSLFLFRRFKRFTSVREMSGTHSGIYT